MQHKNTSFCEKQIKLHLVGSPFFLSDPFFGKKKKDFFSEKGWMTHLALLSVFGRTFLLKKKLCLIKTRH
jgi:hypothetical protein